MGGAQETAIQTVNRTIRDFADDPRIPSDEHWAFFCECGCFTLVSLTVAEFDHGGKRVWAPGHEADPKPGWVGAPSARVTGSASAAPAHRS